MIYFLIFLLSFELLIAFLLNGKRIISPSFIAIGVFLFSSIVYAICLKSLYGTDIHFKTVIIVSCLLLFIIIGEALANVTKKDHEMVVKRSSFVSSKSVYLTDAMLICLTFFVFITSFWYVYDIYRFSLSLGNSQGNFFASVLYVRQATNYGTGRVVYSSGTLLSQCILISRCIVYFSFFMLANRSLAKKRLQWKYLLPIMGYVLYVVFCDSRGYLIADALVFLLIVFNSLNSFGVSRKKQNKTLLLIGIVSLISFFIIFRLLGYRTGTSNNYSFLNNIADYVSSGLLGLDLSLNEGYATNTYFAQSTLRNIYIKLNDFGFDFQLGNSNGAFFEFAGGQSNIYTGLYAPIKDFGFFSTIFLLVWSFLTQKLLNNNNYHRFDLLHCFLIGIMFYPLVMISIGGEWANVLSITSLYQIFYLLLIEIIFIKKRHSNMPNRSFRFGL